MKPWYYYLCPICGFCKKQVPNACHHHEGGAYALLEITPDEYYKNKFGGSQMKTCKTCQGTGQVPGEIRTGDIVENKNGMLGLVIHSELMKDVQKRYGCGFLGAFTVVCLANGAVGYTYTSIKDDWTVRHGHIHIDR